MIRCFWQLRRASGHPVGHLLMGSQWRHRVVVGRHAKLSPAHRRARKALWAWVCVTAGPIGGIPAVVWSWWPVIGGGAWPGSETGNALPNQSGVLVAVPEPSTLWLLLGWLVGAVIVGLAIGRAVRGE